MNHSKPQGAHLLAMVIKNNIYFDSVQSKSVYFAKIVHYKQNCAHKTKIKRWNKDQVQPENMSLSCLFILL